MRDLHRETSQQSTQIQERLAEAVVDRHYASRPGLEEKYGESGRAKCIHDFHYHLSYLSNAIDTASPELFGDYLSWARNVMQAYRVDLEDIVGSLGHLCDVLRDKLPRDMAALAVGYVKAALEGMTQGPRNGSSFLDDGPPCTELARQYLDLLLAGKRQAACRLILDAADQGTPLQHLYLYVFQRCQREIGRLWQLNRLSVAQEHYCTATTQLIMSQLYPRLFQGPRNGRRLVATCVGGELHEIGVRIVSDFFEMEGWETFYLGANAPARDVVRALSERQAHVLALSVTMTFHLPLARDLVAAVRAAEACRDVKILVGGYPFLVAPELWKQLGADGHARDAREAVRLAGRLCASGDRK